MSKKYPVRPVVPSYGVNPDFQQDPFVFSVIDDGSRGWPWAVMFVPCIEVDGKAQIVIDSAINPQDPRGELFSTAYWMIQRETMSPYTLEVASKNWPTQGEFVVLLLLPFQTNGIGSESFLPLWKSLPPEYWETVTLEVKNYLSQATLATLALGRFEQPKKTMLPSGDSTAQVELNLSQAPLISRNSPIGPLTFALASCQYPSDILDQMAVHDLATEGPADASLLALGKQLKVDDPPTLILLVGDQVYVDATAGLFDPKVLDEKYRLPYQRRGASVGLLAIRASIDLTVYSLIDDHEIDDNWDQGAVISPGKDSAIDLGKRGYWEFQRTLKHGKPLPPECWRAISSSEFPFFLADTRTERETRTVANAASRKILTQIQFNALKTWLNAQDPDKPKFIASSSAVLPRHLSVARDPAAALHSDSWDAYPHSLHELLAYICDNEIKSLVFLSGDQHISNVVEASVSNVKTGKTCNFHSVHSSALYAPYPFANAIPEDFARFENFPFSAGGNHYCCTVESTFAPPGDGFAILSVIPPNAVEPWKLRVVFHSAKGPKGDHEQGVGSLLFNI